MKAIKNTNLKTLTVLAALLLLTVSLAIPIQESSAEKEKREKNHDGEKAKNYDSIKQINKCNDYATCINMWCKAGLECYMIIPQENYMRFPMPTYEESD